MSLSRIKRGPAAAAVLLVAVLATVLVLAVLARVGNWYQATDLVSSLIAPSADKTAILVRVVLLVATAAVAGLALARVLAGRRSLVEVGRTSARDASAEQFAEMFADLAAKVSVEAPANATDTSDPTNSPGSPDAPEPPEAPPEAPASVRSETPARVRLYESVPVEVRVVAWVGALAVAAGCTAAVVTGQAARPVAAVQLALALAVPLLIAGRRSVLPVGVAGLALTALLGVESAAGRAGPPLVLDVVYAVVGAILLGTSVFGVAVLPGRARTGEVTSIGGRLTRLAVVSGVVVGVAGIAQLLITGPRTSFDLLHTGYGLAALAQAALPVLVTAIWLVATGPKGRPRAAELSRLAAGGLTLALLAAALVTTFPRPLAAPEPGQPLLRPVNLGLRHLAVLVLPMRPGPNLVHIGDAGGGQEIPAHGHGATPPVPAAAPGVITVSAGSGRGVPVADRAGAPGSWAVLELPVGTDRLEISGDGITATVPVNLGTTPPDPAVRSALTGPDGPECASAALGGLLAGADPSSSLTWAPPLACPSQSLTAADGSSLRDTVTFLAGRGIRALDVISDDSPRSRAAADLVRTEAAQRHLPISATPAEGDTLLVVSGWARAKDALGKATDAATGVPNGGIVLAPWLLTGGVLGSASSEVLALTFNPQNLDPRQYASTVSAVFPGESPSSAGYLSWAAQQRTPLDSRSTFYGSAPVNVPMGMDDEMDMGGEPSDWYPGGTVVPISPTLGTPPHNP